MILIGILAITLISLLIAFWGFSPSITKKEKKVEPIHSEEIIKENSVLRYKAQQLQNQIHLLSSTNNILIGLPPVFSREELERNLSKLPFEKILIDKILVCTYSQNKFTPLFARNIPLHIQPELIRSIQFVIKTIPEPIIETNTVFLKDSFLDKHIKDLLACEFYAIYPFKTSEKLLGFLLCASHYLSNTEILFETTRFLGQHLSHLVNIVNIYEHLVDTQHNLEQEIENRTKQLKEALEEVSQISKAKSEFVSTVAHELRTSLTSIRGFASLIYDGKLGPISDRIRDRIGRIQNQVNRLVDMVNILLDINKIESGKVEMHPERLNAYQLLSSVTDSFLIQLQQKHIRLSLSCPKDIFVYADKMYFERVIHNLLSNAIKFTPEGGEISISAEMISPDTAEITVSDTGIGIHAKDLPHIFKEFYYVDRPEVTNIKGIGLGLSLVKKVIDAHRGKILVESQPNKGTTFRIHIRAEREEGKDVSNTSL